MNVLYNSEHFSVMQLQAVVPAAQWVKSDAPALPREGFEIVDKRACKEVYLEGHWAELFQAHLRAWQESAPSQEEVEETLAGYTALAQAPLAIH